MLSIKLIGERTRSETTKSIVSVYIIANCKNKDFISSYSDDSYPNVSNNIRKKIINSSMKIRSSPGYYEILAYVLEVPC